MVSADTNDPPILVFTYGVSSTTVTYGLPRAKQLELLQKHRARHYKARARLLRARAKARGNRHEHPVPNMRDYDLCCEYYREVYTMQAASGASEYYASDSESEPGTSTTDPSMPPLDPVVEGQVLLADSPDASAFTAADAADDASTAAGAAKGGDVVGAGTHASVPNLQKGERHVNVDDLLFPNGFIPVAELPDNIRFSPTSIPRELSVHTDSGSLERVWSLLNEVNRPQYHDMVGRGRRHNVWEDYEPPAHRLKIFARTGARIVNCRCENGKHTSFERRQAYAFSDGEGNIVAKKSKSLLLELP
ncbi:hypothetical protein C8F04DRAFT_1182923 [Mycena alexandri]|uniref:Uncharacterized protein n=1 Tax=Mycena alexandri TaxID=1745969 RepID=A0AAD6X754_9AGAR|nr:hypothetical protein C8F04DRAFT_1182923 [Mycena alexandri]